MCKIRFFLPLLFAYSIPVFADVTDADFDRCSQFLNKIVSSSNADLISELKVDRSLIIADVDRTSNNNIYAKVQFNNKQSVDTPGEGFLLWVKYDYMQFSLEDITIDPDKPQKLKFDKRYSTIYLNCLNRKSMYKVTGDSRLQFYNDEQLSIPAPGLFILPEEYVEVKTMLGKASLVKYHSKSGADFSAWIDASRIQKINFSTIKQ